MEALALPDEPRTAIDASYEALFTELARFCRTLGAGADAEDIAQETLLAGRSKLDGLHDPGSLRPWLRTIAIRMFLRMRRRRRPAPIADGALVPLGPDLGLDAAAAVGRLPERERLAVVLVYGMGYRQDEAAAVLGVTRGTIAASLWKARRRLARDLADYRREVEA